MANNNLFSQLFSTEKQEEKIEEKSIDGIKKDLENIKDKISFLKILLNKVKEANKKRQVRELLINEIKSKNKSAQYFMGYDSVAEGLEPVYFWLLDFLRNKPLAGIDYDVDKTKEDFEASVGSAFFGDVGSRGTRMQEQAMKMMGTINTVVRSIINLIYDLKEFKMRLENYNNLKSGDEEVRKTADLGLKQTWLDNVDIKRGRGAIHSMAQQLNFVTVRDAFLYAKNSKQVDTMDLNDRVKRVLKPRLEEFNKWKEYSEVELRKRFNIERSYLKSQVSALKLYADWTKPYLIAAQKLGMKDFHSPHIVSVFNNMEIHLTIFGKRLVRLQSMIDSGDVPEKAKSDSKYYACIEVDIMFRSIPHSVRQTQAGMQYTQGGRSEIKFTSYVFKEEDLKYLKDQELFEGIELVDEIAGTALREIHDDLEEFLKEEKKEEPKPKPTPLIKSVLRTTKELTTPIKEVSQAFKDLLKVELSPDYIDSQLKNKAAGNAARDVFLLYDIYKKAHGMLSW
jgi:hypothetical protein